MGGGSRLPTLRPEWQAAPLLPRAGATMLRLATRTLGQGMEVGISTGMEIEILIAGMTIEIVITDIEIEIVIVIIVRMEIVISAETILEIVITTGKENQIMIGGRIREAQHLAIMGMHNHNPYCVSLIAISGRPIISLYPSLYLSL